MKQHIPLVRRRRTANSMPDGHCFFVHWRPLTNKSLIPDCWHPALSTSFVFSSFFGIDACPSGKLDLWRWWNRLFGANNREDTPLPWTPLRRAKQLSRPLSHCRLSSNRQFDLLSNETALICDFHGFSHVRSLSNNRVQREGSRQKPHEPSPDTFGHNKNTPPLLLITFKLHRQAQTTWITLWPRVHLKPFHRERLTANKRTLAKQKRSTEYWVRNTFPSLKAILLLSWFERNACTNTRTWDMDSKIGVVKGLKIW